MPAKKEKVNKLNIKRDDYSSRFIVDLRNHEDYQSQKENNYFWEKLLRKFLYFILKSKEKISLFLNYWYKNKDKIYTFFKRKQKIEPFFQKISFQKRRLDNIFWEIINFYIKTRSKIYQILGWHWYKINKIENLAFFSILKILGLIIFTVIKSIYKIFYSFGWFVVFIVRFIYFFFYKLLSIIDKNLFFTKKIFLSFFVVFNILFSILLFILFFPFKVIGKIFQSIKFFNILLRKKIIKKKKVFFRKFLPSWDFKMSFSKPSFFKKIFKKTRKHFTLPSQLIKKIKLPHIRIWKPKYISIPFTLFLLIISLPFLGISYYKSLHYTEDHITRVAEAAIQDLNGASDSILGMNFSEASQNFSEASQNFLKAEQELGKINKVLFSLAGFSNNKKAQLASQAEKVMAAGKAASNLGADISMALDSLFNSSEKNTLDILDNFIFYGQSAQLEAEKLNSLLTEINIDDLPEEYREQFKTLKGQMKYLDSGLSDFLDIAKKLDDFLGAKTDKRYLLVFQNNAELRATGGFIGSYALIDFKNGEISNLEVPGGGSYDTEGGLKKLVAAPEPLWLVDPLWHFWDANWWPDWPRSAKKLMWFYEKSDGPTVDGVISLTPTVLEKILESFGPIDMTEDYGVVIDKDNFWLVIQDIVENKHVNENGIIDNKPKKIIGDLLNKIIAELPKRLNREILINLFNDLEESLRGKHILFYFTDEELQQKIDEKGWSGRIKKTDSNYLSIINTNIAGGKSDKKIKEIINHKTEVLENGEIINTLWIKRIHTGKRNEPFSGVRNVDWMRIYVPWGSKLIEAKGFTKPDDIYFEEADPNWEQDEDILKVKETERMGDNGTLVYDESGKTVFANWSMVDPGESTVIYLKYKLPFSFKEKDKKLIDKIKEFINPSYNQYYSYSLYIQKQPGALASDINTSLSIPDNYKIIWKYPDNLNITSHGWQTSEELNEDKYQSILIAR